MQQKDSQSKVIVGGMVGASGTPPNQQPDRYMGTKSSNTVPSTSINTYNTKILRTGIDSLYLSYQGELSEESSIRFNELKKLAQSVDPERVALAQHKVNDHLFEVMDRGRNPFSYILKDNWYRISLAKLGAKRAPLAYVQISSELLTNQGQELAVLSLSEIVKSFGRVEDLPSISRLDLCVDFVTDYPMDSIIDEEWVTRADVISNHSSRREYTGTSIGAGGAISARLYNKTAEMCKKPRPYLNEIHSLCGWDGKQQVWRLEFQFMREVLRDLGIRYHHQLNDALAGLWQYATHEWLRHTLPSVTDKTQSRWPASGLWSMLQTAHWQGDKSLVRQPVDKGRLPSDKSLFVNGISGFTSFMAREGITDHYQALTAFFTAVKRYHDNREHITGLDFVAYISQKVALKAREYGTKQNQPQDRDIHPADEAIAREYRKVRDGE